MAHKWKAIRGEFSAEREARIRQRVKEAVSVMNVSTLRSYIKAMGGDLEIKAVFPEGEVQIEQFQGLED
jgi:hypothetical protein